MKKQIFILGFLASTAFGFGQSWNIGGNAGTNPASPAFNYLGTSDNKALVLRANGQEGIRILPNTFVGIGNANPLHKLSVAGNIAFNQNLVSRTQNAFIHWGSGGPGYLSFRTLTGAENSLGNYIERMIIDQNGNVGIGPGALAPSERLHLDGTLRVDGTNGLGGIRVFKDGSDAIASHLYLGNVANNSAFNFQLNGLGNSMDLWTYNGSAWNRHFTFTNGGTFGIGVSSPAAYLHIKTPASAGSGHGLLVEHNDPNGNYASEIRVKNAGTSALVITNATSGLVETFKVYGNGKTQIGNALISGPHTSNYLLSVNGKLVCKEVYVTNTGWADFVFEKNYTLPSLKEVETYYKANKHLPLIPSAAEVEENGISVGEINKLLLQKIEELTIYMVEQQKEIDALKEKVK